MLIKINQKDRKDKILGAIDIFLVLVELLRSKHKYDREKETFWVVILNTANQIKYIDEVSIGNLTNTIVTPREVFRFSILRGAASIIIAHNHPSGNLTPSESDKRITKQLTEAGKIIGIEVLDSLIISTTSYYSFNGMNPKNRK
jgi:DNA repair protein RadC